MHSAHSLTVISLGGGVQSSAQALMASQGHSDLSRTAPSSPTPTGNLPVSTLTSIGCPSISASPCTSWTTGRSLREDAKALTNHSGNHSFVDLPLCLKGRDGQSDGMGRRQCTEHYKIRPIRRKIRELLGLTKGQRVPPGTAAELWLGISTDEAIHMKPSRDRWIQNRYPSSKLGCQEEIALSGGRPATTAPWNAPPASHAPTNHASGGSRPSAGGRTCSPRRSRLTPTSEDVWPSSRSPTCIHDGCPSRRQSCSTRRSRGMASTRTGSATSARDTVASRSRLDRSQKDPRVAFLFRSWYTLRYGSGWWRPLCDASPMSRETRSASRRSGSGISCEGTQK